MEDFIFYLTGEALMKDIHDGDFLYCYYGDRKGQIIISNKNGRELYSPDVFLESNSKRDIGTGRWVLVSEMKEDNVVKQNAITTLFKYYLHMYNDGLSEIEFNHF